jgi:hypothetical protein
MQTQRQNASLNTVINGIVRSLRTIMLLSNTKRSPGRIESGHGIRCNASILASTHAMHGCGYCFHKEDSFNERGLTLLEKLFSNLTEDAFLQ